MKVQTFLTIVNFYFTVAFTNREVLNLLAPENHTVTQRIS